MVRDVVMVEYCMGLDPLVWWWFRALLLLLLMFAIVAVPEFTLRKLDGGAGPACTEDFTRRMP